MAVIHRGCTRHVQRSIRPPGRHMLRIQSASPYPDSSDFRVEDPLSPLQLSVPARRQVRRGQAVGEPLHAHFVGNLSPLSLGTTRAQGGQHKHTHTHRLLGDNPPWIFGGFPPRQTSAASQPTSGAYSSTSWLLNVIPWNWGAIHFVAKCNLTASCYSIPHAGPFRL